MTPQERQLVAELFDRLASLEGTPRDPDAERVMIDGLRRAPNAVYPLVQTVLVQDEALKRANARIEELESGSEASRGGFLDTMRGALLGRDAAARGSVPSIGGGSKWNSAPASDARSAPSPEPIGRGGSFLGTAAAAAAGMIGGSLLFSGIQSLMGGHHGSAFADSAAGFGGGERSPWGNDAANSDLARDAGIGDIGGSPRHDHSGDRAGLFGDTSTDAAADNDDMSDAGDFSDGGVSDA